MPKAGDRMLQPAMGYQPGLDGLRAISVIAVILYHAGFAGIHGGFLGVEVFFVVSGFLITSLLIEERAATGRVSLRQFWLRRARRLLPALSAMLLAVSTWAALFGSAEQTSQLRRDLPWSVLYVANWGQILGDVPYFQPGDPPLLRHLWSLAVEEQWYLLWPLAFVALARSGRRPRLHAGLLAIVAIVVMAFTWVVQRGAPDPIVGGLFDGADRVNFNYLSTITRSSGLLVGAAAAFVWQPWRRATHSKATTRTLDVTMSVGLVLLAAGFATAELTAGAMYPWLLGGVSIVSLVTVLVVVHPAATGSRRVLSWTPLVEVGKRSYGWYLWHWPIFVVVGATDGSVLAFVGASAVSVFVAEISYRYVETPIRQGALGRWWVRRRQVRWVPVGGAAALSVGLLAFYISVEPFDVAAGGDDVTFDLAAIGTTPDSPSPPSTTGAAATHQPWRPPARPRPELPVAKTARSEPPPMLAAPASTTATTAPAPPVTPPELPRSLVIVGDSQAHSLAVNLPSGIGSTFTIKDGSLEGCSVYDSGRVRSDRQDFSNNFSNCRGWLDHWAEVAEGRDVALVVLGAWDVFDLEIDDALYRFGSPAFDRLFSANLSAGVDVMTATGAKVALLEVACMRPVDAKGAGVPVLPERGDDDRVAHLNELQRQIAESRPDVWFVEGPDEWCDDEAISTDTDYRWDGVHAYRPGAKLIYETITLTLLAIPV